MYALFSSARWDFTTDSRILADTHAALATGPAEFRRSGLTRPPGGSSPPSSNKTTPLHSRLQPCSG